MLDNLVKVFEHSKDVIIILCIIINSRHHGTSMWNNLVKTFEHSKDFINYVSLLTVRQSKKMQFRFHASFLFSSVSSHLIGPSLHGPERSVLFHLDLPAYASIQLLFVPVLQIPGRTHLNLKRVSWMIL